MLDHSGSSEKLTKLGPMSTVLMDVCGKEQGFGSEPAPRDARIDAVAVRVLGTRVIHETLNRCVAARLDSEYLCISVRLLTGLFFEAMVAISGHHSLAAPSTVPEVSRSSPSRADTEYLGHKKGETWQRPVHRSVYSFQVP